MALPAFARGAAVAVLAGSLMGAALATEPTPAEKAGMDEYWRHAPRHGCLCCSVYVPAPKAAAVPRDLGSVPVLKTRIYEARGRLACFCVGGKYLWAADDQAVYQIDAGRRALVRTYRAAEGLPDVPVRQLVSDGKWLWIVGDGTVSRLEVSPGRIEIPSQPRFTIARMAAGPAGTFLVTEKAAYRWNAAGGSFESLGAYPGHDHVAGPGRLI